MRLHQLILSAANLESLHNFYVAVLGLREIEAPDDGGSLTVQAGETTLIFRQAPSDWRGRYHMAFDVPPAQFEAAQMWLSQRATALADSNGSTTITHTGWNAASLYFYDPAGNILELIARDGKSGLRDAAKRQGDTAERVFGPHSMMAVTEIGLTTEDVQGAVTSLTTQVPGLKVYDPGDRDTFTALGDESGLFIVVRRGRIWFPNTGVSAELLPLDIIFEVKEGGRYRLTAPPYPFTLQPI